ncbi:sigma factor G inhibitor Gin [Neobacillus notoginsengisoli]|uniref:Sigma factor G inhibitor Gin n=1 Tax=Neobacillus notoginsengisoli TaxID=1578198 RepID=A0A417YG34_9BACI|nr:sigma factor G inhibitor Gin [Neobacillus notoginsengisoli]RHW31781.1 sigma factor G inhibitor Gin [Neobacillus notoginsengisoli]
MEVGVVESQPVQHEETCVVCEGLKKRGIHLYTSFICSDCERDMISTETSDPKYTYYLRQLKKVAAPGIFS